MIKYMTKNAPSSFASFCVMATFFSLVSFGAIFSTPTYAAGDAKHVTVQDWSFNGAFGTYDVNALRRGYKVYQEVCAACHAMELLHFRNLAQEGGPAFSEAEVKAIAALYTVEDGPDEFGDMFERPAQPKDAFVSPFANEQAARASNGGAYPPDLSLITKARALGADYVYALLVGYEDAPQGVELGIGQYYNPYMAGGAIAMAPPLDDDLVEYTDGTLATKEQLASDVVQFLNWAGAPELEERKRIGVMVMIYLSIFAALLFFSMRKIWSGRK